MPRPIFPRIAALLAALLALTPTVRAQDKPTLTISAAASLKDVLTAIDSRYNAATIQVNFGASGALQHQIEQGAPVDVFLSAAAKNMDALAAANLVDAGTRRNIAGNRLVLVVPAGSNSPVHGFQDLLNVAHFAMGAPDSVPAGNYAKQVLTALNLWTAAQPHAVYGKDVREVLTQVELGNVDAGIVYKTDALTSDKVTIVATADEKLHAPIVYPGAVVSDSKFKVAALAYLQFLGSGPARKLFKSFGFVPVKAPKLAGP